MDVQIIMWFQSFANSFFDVVFGAFYYLLNPLFSMFVPIVLFYAFDKKLAYKTGVFYGVTSFFCGTLKEMFSRPRPYLAHPDKITTRIESMASGSSMPSGHAMGSIGLIYPAAEQFSRRNNGSRRVWVMFAAIFVIVIVGLSRVYMGGHYLTDILAGWGFAIAIITALEFAMYKLGDRFYLFGMLMLPVMIVLIYILPESDSCGVGLAFTSAMLIGGFLEHKFVKLDINVVWWKRLIRVLVAANGALICGMLLVSKCFEAALGVPINEIVNIGTKTFAYFLMFFAANAWAFIVCPWLFKYTPALFCKMFKKKPKNL